MISLSRRIGTAHLGACLVLALVAFSGCRDHDTNVPIALTQTPASQGGIVTLTYTLRNPDTVSVVVAIEYVGTDGIYRTATPATGSEPTTGLAATPGGTIHTFLWDARTDLGLGQYVVSIRISPQIGAHTGSPAYTLGFIVDNTNLLELVGALSHGRDGSRAAPTADGSVIVVGGAFDPATELFTPATNALAVGPDLPPSRAHGALVTLVDLDGGQDEPRPVYLGGVDANGTTLSQVDVFDAGNDTWTTDTALSTARSHMQATVLSGHYRVLLSGGRNGTSLVATDEAYDIVPIGAASTTVSPGAQRTNHSATLLPDGRVLVAGGESATGVTNTSLIFDPNTMSYTSGPRLATARADHAAALVGQTLYVLGGRDANGDALASIEIIDAALATTFTSLVNTDSSAVTLLAARYAAAVQVLGTRSVVLTGGRNQNASLVSGEIFHTAYLTIRYLNTPLHQSRDGHDATVVAGGNALLTGGGTRIVERYVPPAVSGNQSLSTEVDLPPARTEHSASALADGRVLLCGGTNGIVDSGALVSLATATVFDKDSTPASRFSATAGTLIAARRHHSATTLADGRVVLAGGLGTGGVPIASMESYNPATDSFSALSTTLPVATYGHSAVRLTDGRVLLCGGQSASSVTAAALIYDPAGPSLTAIGTMQHPRADHAAVLLASGKVLLAGGYNTPTTATSSAELFNPADNTFTLVSGNLGDNRIETAYTLLSTGDVIFAGGRQYATTAPIDAVVLYSATTESLATLSTPLAENRAGAQAMPAALGRALITGGFISAPVTGTRLAVNVTASAEIYDPTGSGATIEPLDPDLTQPSYSATVTPLTDGSYLRTGGRTDAGVVRQAAERVTP